MSEDRLREEKHLLTLLMCEAGRNQETKRNQVKKKNQGTKQMTQEHIHRYSELSGGCSGELAGGRAQG